MASEKRSPKRISLTLTPEQQKQILGATGKKAVAIEFAPEELEERIAPTDNIIHKHLG